MLRKTAIKDKLWQKNNVLEFYISRNLSPLPCAYFFPCSLQWCFSSTEEFFFLRLYRCIGLPERRCDDGGICLIYRYDSDFSHSVSSEVSLYYPTDIYDGMSGTYLLQSGDDARAEYLHTGRNVLYFRFFQNVGYI